MSFERINQSSLSTRVYNAVSDTGQQLSEKFSHSLPVIARTVVNVAAQMPMMYAFSQLMQGAQASVSPEPCFRRCDLEITDPDLMKTCYIMCEKAFDHFFGDIT